MSAGSAGAGHLIGAGGASPLLSTRHVVDIASHPHAFAPALRSNAYGSPIPGSTSPSRSIALHVAPLDDMVTFALNAETPARAAPSTCVRVRVTIAWSTATIPSAVPCPLPPTVPVSRTSVSSIVPVPA